MALVDNKRLYDIATRQQVYVEGVKVQQSHEFDLFLIELAKELRDLLARIQFSTLDSMTKSQLNRFIQELRKTQARLYSRYLNDLLKQLQEFMEVSLTVTRQVYTSTFIENLEDEETEILDEAEIDDVLENADEENKFAFLFGLSSVSSDTNRLWSKITNTIIPANGLLMLPMFKNFAVVAQSAIENLVRKAYANGDTVDALRTEIFNYARQGIGGQLQRTSKQGASVLATAMQHIAEMVSAGITSGLYRRYRWYSVIDSSTTDICISRNLKVFAYGVGPLPPAHWGCRSHIAPIVGGAGVDDETYAKWYARQPKKFQDDVSKQSKFSAVPLTFDQYTSKVATILSR